MALSSFTFLFVICPLLEGDLESPIYTIILYFIPAHVEYNEDRVEGPRDQHAKDVAGLYSRKPDAQSKSHAE